MNSKKIFTIPNILSAFRILLVPVIVWMYFQESVPNHFLIAFMLVILSGLTDICDGIIARRFNMISDIGKILDPIADKLTQFAVIFCIAWNYKMMIVVAAVIFAKELLMLIGALLLVKHGSETPYARWWGKATTVVLYATMLLFILAEFLNLAVPDWIITTAVALCVAFLVFSLLNYALVFIDGRKSNKKSDKTN